MEKNGNKKSVLIVGLGRFGSSVAKNLSQLGCEIVVVDAAEQRVGKLVDIVEEGVVGDVQDVEFLRSLGVSNFDIVVVGIGYDIKASVLVVTLVRELGAKYVVAKSYDTLHTTILNKLGVDRVVAVEEEMGRRVAMAIEMDTLIDFMELTPDFRFVEMKVLERWIGREINDIKTFQNHDLMLVAIKRDDKVISNPDDAVVLQAKDVVVVCGHRNKLQHLI